MYDPNKGDSDLPKVYHLHQKKEKRNFCQKLEPFTLKDKPSHGNLCKH